MGRRKFLEQALSTWLSVKQINRIIIVDWGAKENLPELIKMDERIVVLQVPRVKFFDPGAAWNVGYRCSKSDYVFQIDGDVKLNVTNEFGYLLKGITLGEYYGIVSVWHNWKKSPGVYGGTMIVDRKYYNALNGYAEGLVGWGIEDDNFIRRIRKFKSDFYLDRSWFSHIEHDAKIRVCNMKSFLDHGAGKGKGNDEARSMVKMMDVQHQPRKPYLCIEYTISGKKEMVI